MSAFYAAHLAAHRINSLVFGHVNVSEAQCTMMAIRITTAVGGLSILNVMICVRPAVTVGYAVCIAIAGAILRAPVQHLSCDWTVRDTACSTWNPETRTSL
jgi:hypothetical protein